MSDEIASFRAAELRQAQQQSQALWARVMAGEDSPRLRQRIERLEALQTALMGYPAVLAD
jgi:hypothetical protein